MRILRQSVFWGGLVIALAAFTLTPSEVSNARAKNPFDSLLGTWTGSGKLVLQGGQWENIKCNAYYTGGVSELRLAVRCASASYKVEIRSKLTRAGDKISGTWEERTYNAAGSVSGRALGNRLSLSISNGAFSGSMSVSYGASEQSVSISTAGINLKSVNMTLSRIRG
jgi:hypothetical protein